MDKLPCAFIQQQMRAALTSGTTSAIEPSLAAHVADCATCRGALMLLMADFLGIFPMPAAITCDTCQEDLPAFIDRERAAGAAVAAREYPQVWWHLWTCEDCAAVYEFVNEALDLPPLAQFAMPSLAVKRVRVLHLSRKFLIAALPVHSSLLGATRGSNDEPVVISERTINEGRSMRLSVEEQADQGWCVLVEIVPVPAGWLVIQLGDQSFRARFDERGYATVSNIPAMLLTGVDGPDLTVEIEADA